VAGEDLDKHQYQVQNFTPGNIAGQPIRCMALKGADKVLGWVQNSNSEWYARSQGWGIATSAGVTLGFSGLAPNGAWTVQWWDTVSGLVAQAQAVQVSGGSVTLTAPQLDSGHPDWAFKLVPGGGTPTLTPTPAVFPIPGRVQAEDFSASYDLTAGNLFGQYRAGDVDLEACSEGGFNVGEVAAGEWLEYQVHIAAAGNYDFSFRVASQNPGPFSIQVQLDGANLGAPLSFNGSGGWQAWANASLSNLSLPAGRYSLRLNLQTDLFNLNFLELTPRATPTPSPTGTPSRTPSATPTPSRSASATASATSSPTRSATPSLSPTPSASATASLSATLSPALSPSASPTATPSFSPGPSASATPSASPSRTPAPPSATASASATSSPSPLPSASATRSATPPPSPAPSATRSSTRTPAPTGTATPTAPSTPPPTPPSSPTPVVIGNLNILQANPVPNPNPTVFYVNLSAWADSIELLLYTSAGTLVKRQVSGPHYNGWTLVYLPQDFLSSAANGTYFYTMIARNNAGAQSAPAKGTLALYR
jgi:hypothetical protein